MYNTQEEKESSHESSHCWRTKGCLSLLPLKDKILFEQKEKAVKKGHVTTIHTFVQVCEKATLRLDVKEDYITASRVHCLLDSELMIQSSSRNGLITASRFSE
mmetsp:Transcript_17185/g.22472  ORF Transcript_17185/g.22472 Transcript_17185/m.22472 type:complete len:103 (+) Transcript_17185:524-832(+)